MKTLFGTDGIRGKAGEFPLDAASMFALGESLAHRLRRHGLNPVILLGMDTRESGPAIAKALTAGIRAGEGEARFVGIVPTPAVAYLCRIADDAAAGISISASHNPYQDNGVKVFGHDGMKLSDKLEKEIEDEMLAIRRAEEPDLSRIELASSESLIVQYEDFLVSGVAPNALRGCNVVLDTGNGAACRIAPDVFRRAGAGVTVINDTPDGRNINLNSGALHPERLAKVVVEQGADFGVAFDGDADRAIFVDDRGAVRDGDEIIYLWALNDKKHGRLSKDTVVTTVMSNLGFELRLKEQGIALVRAQVGDKYVLEKMIASGSSLGGEQSGHIIDLKVHTTGDGVHTAVVMGVLLAGGSNKFSEIPTFTPVPQLLLNERVGSKPSLERLPKYNAARAKAEEELGDRGRILVRYSGTENLVRVMVEGENDALIRQIARQLADVLRDEIATLKA